MAAALEDVYCTLVMNDAYLPGATVLAHSLRDSGSTKKLACLATVDTLNPSTLDQLRTLYNYVIPVEKIGTPNPKNLYLMNRADLLYTFTKLHLWRQTQFRKIVYIDADVVALRAPEELFEIQDHFAAAPDVGWPDAFNSGVMVITPNDGDWRALQSMASAGDSFDGADQGLLNQYYENKPWKRLSFVYNCTPSANYQYEPAYRYYKSKISLVHFIGSNKPWTQDRNAGGPNAYQELLARWWSVWDRHHVITPTNHEIESTEAPSRESSYSKGYPINTEPAPPPMQRQHPKDVQEHKQPFAAPQMQWDGTRRSPPLESNPEALNFPSQVYTFNEDRQLFTAPEYPEPPKDMWFEVPKEKPRQTERPAPIFPWEERDVPRPTRRFADDKPVPVEEDDMNFDEFGVSNDTSGSITPTITVSDTSWDAFASAKNAWDENLGIDNYVRALTSWQKNRGKVQVVHSTNLTEDLLETLTDKVNERRESLILTDFPTAIERPSLPVTPAPRRRTFWGEDREEDASMPSADGVPNQIDWVRCPSCGFILQTNPTEQLEQLRRNSLLGPENLKLAPTRQIPIRDSIASAASIPEEALGHPVALVKEHST